MGICSGNGVGGNTERCKDGTDKCDDTDREDANNGCNLISDEQVQKQVHSSITVGSSEEPDQSKEWFCTCNKNPAGGAWYLGEYCQHECPMSHVKTCSGHGTCSVFNDGEGVEKVGCQCDDGFFGTGCELTCPGSLDGGGDTSNPDTVCGGHGVCDVEEKFRTGEPPVSVCCLHKTRSVLPTAFTLSVFRGKKHQH